MTLRAEIWEQPAAARRLLDEGPADFGPIAAAFSKRRPSFAVLAARGSSDNAALYAQYLLGIRNSLAVALATPSAITLYGAQPRMADALVVGISQSGRSPDIVAVLDEARSQGATTVAICNDIRSPLAEAAEHVVDLRAGPELATAATKSYTTELIALAMLSLALDQPTTDEEADLDRLPALMEEALRVDFQAQQVAAGHVDRTQSVVLGRGYEYATAREWALKLQELCLLQAVPFSAADFEHGPLALAEAGFEVLAVAPAGPSLEAQLPLLRRLRDDHGAHLLVISDDAAALALDEGLPLPKGIPGWLSPVIDIVPGQLYAYHLTVARGLDPENPRTITKVTQTR